MTNALTLSSRIYGRLLVFYPEDLRRGYGAEMALVFAEDLDAARREAGMCGVIRVWRCALGEFLRYALPGQASSPAVRVIAISLSIALLTMGGEIMMALYRGPAPGSRLLYSVGTVLLMPALSTPLIALLSMWVCRGHAVLLLGLSGVPGGAR